MDDKMADWPPVTPVKTAPSPQEKEKTYLQLVDMFVDIVEPDIIQMILQNRNWDVDSALEDIMILTTSVQPDSAQKANKKPKTTETQTQNKVKKNKNACVGDDTDFSHHYSPSSTENKVFAHPQDVQVKSKKPATDKSSPYVPYEGKKGYQLNIQPFMEQYSYVKAAKVPFDRAVMLIKDGVKMMIILRGPPGCGKSFLARKLLLDGGIEPSAHKRHIFSSDEFFVQNNVYMFVPELLSQAHLWNQRSVASAIREEVSPVIVDNTNTQAWEMRVYAEMAVLAGYDLEIVEPETWWFKREGELAKRNVHGVPKAKIRQMLERYEKNITPDMLMKQFDLKYSISKAPPQPTRNCKWRDKLSNQRNNKPKKKKGDFSPKPQSNSNNNSSMFQPFPINSSCFSLIGNDSASQFNTPSSSYFSAEENLNSVRPKKITQKLSEELKFKESKEESQDYKNGESSLGECLVESDTNKLFENLVINSDNFLKSFGQTSKSSKNNTKAPELFNDNILSGNPTNQVKDSFDFMAEAKKLLEALSRPSSSDVETPNLQFDQSQNIKVLTKETMENSETPQSEVFGYMDVDKSRISLTDEKYSTEIPEFDKSFNFENGSNLSSEDKINIAHYLVDNVIDKAINYNQSSCVNDKCVEEETISDRGLSWDYVIVNEDKTFTYQRKNSIPFGLPVVIKNNPDIGDEIFSISEVDGKCAEDLESRGACGSKVDDCVKESQTLDNKLIMSDTQGLNFLSCLEVSKEPLKQEKNSQSDILEESVQRFHTNLTDTGDHLHLDFGNVNTDEFEKTEENSAEMGNKNNPDLLEMMKDILCTIGPLNKNYNSFDNNAGKTISDTQVYSSKEQPKDKYENFLSTTVDETCGNINTGNGWDSNKISSEESQPKPARNLRRPKLIMKVVKPVANGNYLGNWDTVSNAAETWSMESVVEPDISQIEALTLPQRSSPQRSKNSKKMVDSSTNTNYQDFSLISGENLTGIKVLIGNINAKFSKNFPEANQNIVERLSLDKSTMTVDEPSTVVSSSYDITQITSLFPNIPEKYILDMVEKCQGDIDWAVDLLLDSEHIIAPISIEPDDSSNSNFDEKVDTNPSQDEITSSLNVIVESCPKQGPKSPSHEQTELKRLIENSVIFDKSHYSDKHLKVLKRKHPEYVDLVEKSTPEDKNIEKSEAADSSQGEKTEDEVDEVEEESSSSGCEVETEDDTMDLIMSNDLILQLQQKFGTTPLPQTACMTPIVKLPLSFARQLFGYIMDSLQSDMDEEQSCIEEMIARDEEVARLLQFQDDNSKPQLQEVMDMEIALAMHRADQEELKEKGTETLAAKLSKNILLEKFPQVDPKMLWEVLQAHHYSLSDTISSLTLGLGVGPAPPSTGKPQELPKEDTEKVTSIIVSNDSVSSPGATAGGNPVSEAAAHRAQAASYYSLRMECLRKAQEAFRSGNKTVATYYSQLAQIHKERMDQSNTKAAACLFSSHKTGANTLDLHFLHIREAEVVLDMFLDEVVTYVSERNKRHQTVFLITGRGLRSVGGVSRIKPMVQRKLQGRGIPYNEVNPGMLSALVRSVTPLSYTL